MADKRIRENSVQTSNDVVDTIYTPNEKVETPNQYESVLQRLQELENANKTKDVTIAELSKQVKEAKWDISEQVKESKRKYWFEIDWTTRIKEEFFKFRFNCLIDENKEKVVIESNTIGRPTNYKNSNTWNWNNKHDLEITFHDGKKTTMDILDYINQKFQYEEFVDDNDIEVKDGKKYYTFRTKNFWTFTIKENFIN
jgi:hypothetical protein